jgi:putative ABC transport system permease protein
MAWRNIFRQKRRTLIALSALIVGLAGLVVFQGYIARMMTNFRDGTILSGLGHVQVAGGEGYWESGEYDPYKYLLADPESALKALRSQPGVLAAFPSTGFTSIAGFGEKSVTLLVKAYPAERMYFTPSAAPGSPAGSGSPTAPAPADRFRLGLLVAGAAPGPEERDCLVLGETAARILGAKLGDVVTLMGILPAGALNGRDFRVSGIYRDAGRDKIFAFTDYATAMDFTLIDRPPVVHAILDDAGRTDAVLAALPKDLPRRGWKELAPFFIQVNTMFAGFLQVIRAIILIVTLFILGNTMNRIVFERMREWGTLRAIGVPRRSLLALVVLEGSFLGLAGSALGIAFGFALSRIINLCGGLPFSQGAGFPVFMIKLAPDARAVWLNAIPAVATAALASLFPARRAVRMTPAECLRQI